MRRLFIGIRPFPEVLIQITNQLKGLRSQAPAGLRWIERDQLHFTLRFLGMTPEKDIPAIEGALSRVAKSVGGSFPVSLSGVGTFRSRKGSCAIWLGVREGAETFREIAEKLDSEFKQLGLRPEARPFLPHLTVARGPFSSALEKQMEAMSMALPLFERFQTESLILFESETPPSGAIYHERARVKLGVNGLCFMKR